VNAAVPVPVGDGSILTLNGGSSSIKFALFAGACTRRIWSGAIDRIGPDARLQSGGETRVAAPVAAGDHAAAIAAVLAHIGDTLGQGRPIAIGHRIVHGGPEFVAARRLDPETIAALRCLAPLDPDHMPPELALVEAARRAFPGTPQIGCFDTGFHHGLPRVAQLLAIPRRYQHGLVRRYGFHGLSYEYLMHELRRLAGTGAADGRVILAHLGSGSSLSAVHHGRPVETSMGFTPASGVMMATRSGDIDPGLGAYLARRDALSPAQYNHMLNCESGLLGLSETSGDMHALLACAPDDPRAAEAIALYCHLVKQRIGAFAATLGGLDTLVFAGGIGENVPAIRAAICDGLGFLGITIDPARNKAGASVISADHTAATVRVIATDEEIMMARHVGRLIAPAIPTG
jgi:acetate kinase